MRKSLGGGLPKLALGLFVALVVLLGLAPGLGLREALADDVSVLGNGVNSPSAKVVKLGGKKWQVVGYKGVGVAQTSVDNTATVLLDVTEMPQEDTKFSNSSSNHYGGSILQEKIANIYSSFSEDEKSVIAARDLIGGGTYDTANPQNFCDRVSDSSTVAGQHLWPLSSYESIRELDRTIRFATSDWWLRSPGNTSDRVAYYSCMYDNVVDSGQEAKDYDSFVRPACYVNLDAVASVTRNNDDTYTLVPKPPHTHNFSYSVTGATITAACANQGCPITDGLSLSIIAPANTTYDGTAKEATLSTGYDTTAFPGPYAIVYKQGEQELEGAPISAGTYTASITVGEVTATVDYTITKAPAPTVRDVQVLKLLGGADAYNIEQSVAGVMPPDAGNKSYTVGEPSQVGSTFTVNDFNVSSDGLVTATVTYAGLANAGDKVTLPVTITSDKYEDTTVNVAVELTVKPVTTVTLDPASVPNKTYGDSDFTVTASVTDKGTGDASWTWYSSDDTVLQVLSTQNTENGGSQATIHILKPGSAMIAAVYETEGTQTEGKTTGAVIGAAVTNAITVAKRPLTITAINQEVYVGVMPASPASPAENTDYTVDGLLEGDSVAVSTLSFQKNGQVATPTSDAPGTYDIVPSGATVSRDGADVSANYDVTYQNGTLTIKAKDAQIIVADDVTVTYGETGKRVSAAANPGSGLFSYSVMDGSKDYIAVDPFNGTLTVKAVPASGTAYVIVKAEGGFRFEEATKSVAVTINKANAAPATVEANDRTYDKTEKPLVNVTGAATGGTMQYSTDGKEYSENVPAATNAGSYTVWYKVAGDENHNDTEPQQVQVTIGKAAPPTITDVPVMPLIGSATTYPISQSLAGVMPDDAGTLTYAKGGDPDKHGATNFTVSDFAVSAEGVVSVRVTYTGEATPDDQFTLPVKISSENYQDTTVNVDVKPTLKTITTVTLDPAFIDGKTYGDESFELTATVSDAGAGTAANWQWYSSDESVLKVTGNGSKATVQILKAGSAMVGALYEPTGGSVIGAAVTDPITVAKRPLAITASNREIYVGGEVPALPASPTVGTDYTIGPNDGGLADGDSLSGLTLAYQENNQVVTPTSDAAGTYDIVPSGATVFKGDADVTDNYDITIQNGTLTVKAKNAQTITAEDVTVTYGETDKKVTATTDGGGSISYAVSPDSEPYIEVDSNGALTVTKVPANGTATVVVTASGTDAYEQATKDVTVTINKADATSATVTPNDRVYDGNEQPLVNVTGDATGGTMLYSTDGTNYLENVPAGTDAGKYTVWYKVAGDENHNDVEARSLVSTISNVSFPDVAQDAWFHDVVYRAVGLGLFNGYGTGGFGPNDNITRGQVAVVLWNMAGGPEVGPGAKDFPDVKSDAYYYNAVRWASSVGVVNGYGNGNGNFGPNDNVVREQFAAMLANYAQHVAKMQVTGSAADYDSMADKDSVSSWAQTSVGWCFRNKIISGSEGLLRPQGNASRAEAAKMAVFLHDLS